MSRRPVDVGDLAASGAAEHPDRVAVSWAGQHRTWSQLAERVASGAAAQRLLRARTGRPGRGAGRQPPGRSSRSPSPARAWAR